MYVIIIVVTTNQGRVNPAFEQAEPADSADGREELLEEPLTFTANPSDDQNIILPESKSIADESTGK